MTNKKIGVLLTNTGTPDDPSTKSVRRYLREFLSDRRIIQLPRALWLPILYSFVLTLRPRRSAQLYQKIWAKDGAPLRIIMQKIAQKLQQNCDCYVEVGMNYGNPSIASGLAKLQHKNIEKLIALPLFPQYSNTTTASSYDRIFSTLKNWKKLPHISFINHYADHQDYIHTLAATTKAFWDKQNQSSHLLISFHGIPERYVHAGDPYATQCQLTANLLANELNLLPHQWTLCYQSQFGYDKWLKPSTQSLLGELPKRDIKHIDIICPGFAVDCLETLEEIAINGQHIFRAAGGESLRYIPALNEQDEHIQLLANVISSYVI